MREAIQYTHDDGIKAYSKWGLPFYDALIVCGLAPRVWSCPPEAFLNHYDQHVTANHADVGVGTGFFLDRCEFRTALPRLALIDLQANCLAHTARRLARYRPETYIRDACQPIHGIRPFDSIALGGILHCLPGDMRSKGRVFDHVLGIARPNARIFGYTLVNDAIPDRLSRRLAWRLLHELRVINCVNDSARDLISVLSSRFTSYRVELIGCFAFFEVTAPRAL
jgi:hypothetical protein